MTALFEAVDETRSESHLAPDEMARLRELLLEELQAQLDQASEQGRTVAEFKAEPGAALGQFEVDWEIAQTVVAWSHEALAEIEGALARMEDGTYGICEQCALSIPFARLEAIPHARYCVSCQGRRDVIQ